MGNNLTSPNSIYGPVDIAEFDDWFAVAVAQIQPLPIRDVLALVGTHLDSFICFPERDPFVLARM